jgi:hypothetical protein
MCRIAAGPPFGRSHESSDVPSSSRPERLVQCPLICGRQLQLQALNPRFAKGCQETTEGLRQVFQATTKGHEEVR